jgi:hypothetical protein
VKSVFLYVAIVAVWGAVLVPMWLRHDADNVRSVRRVLGRRPPGDAEDPGEAAGNVADESDETADSNGADGSEVPKEAGEPDPDDLDDLEDFEGFDDPDDAEDMDGLDEVSGETHFAAMPGMPARSDPPAAPDARWMPSSDPPAEPDADAGPILPGQILDPAPDRRRAPRPRRSRGRGAVMARRRRRTLVLCCLVVAAGVAVTMGAARWWLTMPPVALLAGHLAMLRAAARIDAERRFARRAARAAQAPPTHAATATAAPARRHDPAESPYADEPAAADAFEHADVIDLTEQRSTREVYDQYVDAGLRAVGD